jgi:hypothetical protein
MTLEDSVHDFRLLVLRQAKETGNVSAVCREFGVSRTLFYRWKRRLERYGADGVHPRRRAASRGRPPALAMQDERSILALRGVFDETCRALGITHTRTKPRHAWTNGFVERLQGTILHEHWRVAFRRRYFTSRRQLQDSLDRYLRYYNEQRPHSGYRTRGRTPSEIFRGVTR